MAGHHHDFLTSARATLVAERDPGLQRDLGGQRLRARKIDVLGGNADRLQWQKGRGNICRQQFAHPREIGVCDHDVGGERQMRAVLLGRGQRQHRNPAAPFGHRNVRPTDVDQSRGGAFEIISRKRFIRIDLRGRLGENMVQIQHKACICFFRNRGSKLMCPTGSLPHVMGQKDRGEPRMSLAVSLRTLTAAIVLALGIPPSGRWADRPWTKFPLARTGSLRASTAVSSKRWPTAPTRNLVWT